MTLKEREDLLTAQHGEVTSFANAGRILSRNSKTIKAMLDGWMTGVLTTPARGRG